MNQFEQAETPVFDHLPMAVVKIDSALNFFYANSLAQEWFGSDILQKNLRDLVPEDLWPEMEQQLAKRKQGVGDFYDTQFRQIDGQYVPVKITGIPLVDCKGQHIGSTGLIRNMLFDEVSAAVHRALSEAQNGCELLDMVAAAVRRLVPFDYFGVNRYSADLHYVRSFHRHDPEETPLPISVRWWKLPDAFQQGLGQPRVEKDFSKLMEHPQLAKLRHHPTVEQFVNREYRSYLRIPVRTGGRLVATVSLFSRQEGLYSDQTVEHLRGLPLEQTVQMGLHFDELEEQRFRRELLRDLPSCEQPVDLAKLFVTKLAEHYEWSHVGIFRVDEKAKEFRIVAEQSTGAELLGSGFRQPLDQGVLGQVLKEGRSVIIPDLRDLEHTEFVPRVIREQFRSELCVPVVRDDAEHIRMLLNVEDEMEGAFSNDELATLEEILDEIQPALRRLANQFVLESAFRSSPDAILVADALGKIRKVNSAAEQLLKCKSTEELRQAPLKSFFTSQREADRLMASPLVDGYATRLRTCDGSSLEVLLDMTELPEVIGAGKYIKIQDLAPIRRLQRLEAIGEFYYELAAQTATPLSLVKTWLTQLLSTTGEDDYQFDLLHKALLQLTQVEITQDRMQLYDEQQARRIPTNREHLDLLVELRLLLQEFPCSESKRIELHGSEASVIVIADRLQVAFIFKTIFAYLLRHLPPGDQSTIQVRANVQKRVHVEISSIAPCEPPPSHEQGIVAHTKFQLALGEPLLHTFAANNQAAYHGRKYGDGQIVFEFDFEAA